MPNRILIIDDDKELCALIKQSVAAENIDSDCCYSGIDGLTMLAKNDYQHPFGRDDAGDGRVSDNGKNTQAKQRPHSHADFQK